jgi:hypothetical protein
VVSFAEMSYFDKRTKLYALSLPHGQLWVQGIAVWLLAWLQSSKHYSAMHSSPSLRVGFMTQLISHADA